MKSAYELAMERLEKSSGPTRKLSDEDKAKIADIEKVWEAKIAEAKLSYAEKMRAAGSIEEYNHLQAELSDKIRSLEEHRDRDKEAVWNTK